MILQRSLTLRLTFFFSAAAIVVLTLLSLCLKNEINGYFIREDNHYLRTKAQMIEKLIAKTHFNHDFSEIIGSMEKLEGVAIKIDNPDDRIVLYTSDHIRFPEQIVNGDTQSFIDYGIEKRLPNYTDQPAFKEEPALENIKDDLLEWQDENNFYRGMQFRFTLNDPKRSAVVVTLALNINHHQRFLNNFTAILIKFVLIGGVFSALLHWFVTYQGLKPLQVLSKKAKLVSGKDIKQRMPVDNLPVEIAGLSETLNSMLARLEDAFARLENFSSDIAHELRTPVNNMMMQTQVALSQPRSSKEYQITLASNAEELERLAKMIADMLFLAKTENQFSLLSTEHLFLEQEIADLFEFYDALAEDRNIKLQLKGKAEVQGDRLMLRRAFSNLISNAIRHSDEDGEIHINISSSRQCVTVEVTNSGQTIAAEDLAHLFERFYRVDKARACCSQERVGLGLAITQSIAKAHNGNVYVRSEDQVTTFTFTLNEVNTASL